MAETRKARLPREDRLVLCYHAVSPTWPIGLAVTPSALERQVGLLLNAGYAPATFWEIVHGPPARRAFAVTFDDGVGLGPASRLPDPAAPGGARHRVRGLQPRRHARGASARHRDRPVAGHSPPRRALLPLLGGAAQPRRPGLGDRRPLDDASSPDRARRRHPRPGAARLEAALRGDARGSVPDDGLSDGRLRRAGRAGHGRRRLRGGGCAAEAVHRSAAAGVAASLDPAADGDRAFRPKVSPLVRSLRQTAFWPILNEVRVRTRGPRPVQS